MPVAVAVCMGMTVVMVMMFVIVVFVGVVGGHQGLHRERERRHPNGRCGGYTIPQTSDQPASARNDICNRCNPSAIDTLGT